MTRDQKKEFSIKNIRCIHLEALVEVCTVKLLLMLFPLRWILAGVTIQNQSLPPKTYRKAEGDLAKIGRAIRSIARRLPFKAACLVQALAALLALRLRGRKGELYIGVQKPKDGPFAAHAWLVCDQQIITGGSEYQNYTVLAKYIKSSQ